MSSNRVADAAATPATASGLEARLVAWRVLQAVAAGAYADGALERELNKTTLSSLDRALATELAYGSIRHRRLLDAWLDQLGRVPAERQPPKLRWLLHLGLYQLLLSNRVPPSAAVHTSVELARCIGLSRLAAVVNAVLRNFERRRAAGAALSLPDDPARALAIRHSLPDWLAIELLNWLPADRAEQFGAAANRPPAIDLRVNQRRATREQVLNALESAGVSAAPIEALPWGVTLASGSGDLRHLPGYGEGHWCVQDRSAQRIAPLLDPKPGECILDACAAPGGKTTHLAELIGDEGEIWAIDRDKARLGRIQRNCERLGLRSPRIHHQDAGRLKQESKDFPSQFDRILIDAPCSGLGTLSRHADARWRITPESVEQLIEIQRHLLEQLLPRLKPGGRLVYATCSVHPRENESLINDLCQQKPELKLHSTMQIWPGEDNGGGDGFFAACLSR